LLEEELNMENPFSSLQSQNPISLAQQSVKKAHRAVTQAQSHPREETLEGARNAIEKAENAISQAEGRMNPEPIERAKEDLAEDQAALAEVENQLES